MEYRVFALHLQHKVSEWRNRIHMIDASNITMIHSAAICLSVSHVDAFAAFGERLLYDHNARRGIETE